MSTALEVLEFIVNLLIAFVSAVKTMLVIWALIMAIKFLTPSTTLPAPCTPPDYDDNKTIKL